MARKTKELTLRERYERLELALLDRVSRGIEKIVRRKDGSEERTIEYPDQLAVALLKMHRASTAQAGRAASAADVQEVRERLLKKFERFQKRLGKEDPERG